VPWALSHIYYRLYSPGLGDGDGLGCGKTGDGEGGGAGLGEGEACGEGDGICGGTTSISKPAIFLQSLKGPLLADESKRKDELCLEAKLEATSSARMSALRSDVTIDEVTAKVARSSASVTNRSGCFGVYSTQPCAPASYTRVACLSLCLTCKVRPAKSVMVNCTAKV
jgi:hypothetical protein